MLKLAYMNRESFRKSLETGTTWFYSRSRRALWNKGETSGHTQTIVGVWADCDDDTLLLAGQAEGGGLPTPAATAVFTKASGIRRKPHGYAQGTVRHGGEAAGRKKQEGSYTCYLFEKGLDKI